MFVLFAFELKLKKQGESIRVIRILTCTLLILFLGLRGHLMSDWMSYYPYFDSLPSLVTHSSSDLFGGIQLLSEPLFYIYSVIIKTVVDNYFFWIFIHVLIDIFILDRFFHRYSSYYVLSFIVFFVFGGAGLEINMLRNIKAIMLFLLSFQYLEARKPLPYFLLNSVGLLFHVSSILYFPLYFIVNKQFSKKFIWGIFIVGNVIFLLKISFIFPILKILGQILGGRIEHVITVYGNLDIYSKGYALSVGFIERNITFILFALYYQKLTLANKYNKLFFNIYLCYFVTFFFFSDMTIITERVPNLFFCSYWVLYPNMFKLVENLRNQKLVFYYMVLLLCFKTTSGFGNILCRYDNVITGVSSFAERKYIFQKYGSDVIK